MQSVQDHANVFIKDKAIATVHETIWQNFVCYIEWATNEVFKYNKKNLNAQEEKSNLNKPLKFLLQTKCCYN